MYGTSGIYFSAIKLNVTLDPTTQKWVKI